MIFRVPDAWFPEWGVTELSLRLRRAIAGLAEEVYINGVGYTYAFKIDHRLKMPMIKLLADPRVIQVLDSIVTVEDVQQKLKVALRYIEQVGEADERFLMMELEFVLESVLEEENWLDLPDAKRNSAQTLMYCLEWFDVLYELTRTEYQVMQHTLGGRCLVSEMIDTDSLEEFNECMLGLHEGSIPAYTGTAKTLWFRPLEKAKFVNFDSQEELARPVPAELLRKLTERVV